MKRSYHERPPCKRRERPLLKSALAMAHMGNAIFPCKPDKSPYTDKGFKDATTNPGEVSAFWTKHPNALIGMPTGSWSDVVVLDVDRHEALAELEPELVEELGETLTVR